jgi:hypothetical protein
MFLKRDFYILGKDEILPVSLIIVRMAIAIMISSLYTSEV